MKSVAIIGAGITGLTAAFYLKRKGVPVTVYEAGGRAGGVIQSSRQNGFLAEAGPNTLLETSPKIAQLIRDAGLESRRLNTSPQAEARYVVRGGRPVAMPSSQLGIFTSELLSAKSKLAILREPFVPPRRDGVEESVAEFVTRRLNQEFLDRMVDALVAGIYAGDPHRLSVQHALPRLKALEDKYGSLIKGQFYGARERKKTGEVARDRAPKLSFDEGLQVLPDTLAAQLGDSLKLKSPVKKLAQTNNGWRVTFSEEQVPRVPNQENESEHSAIIYCGTAYRLAELPVEVLERLNEPLTPALSPFGGGGEKDLQSYAGIPSPRPSGEKVAEGRMRGGLLDLSLFSEIRYPPVASVVLGFRCGDVGHSCQGFGMLIPKIEGFNILGTIFSSSLFPNRAPAGHVLLTNYIGGERQPELASLPPEKLTGLVCEDLRKLLGVRREPVFTHHHFWPRAIPQYNLGYGKFKDRLNKIESQSPGLFFAGHYRDGVSLGDSIVSGVNIAERIEKYLVSGQPTRP